MGKLRPVGHKWSNSKFFGGLLAFDENQLYAVFLCCAVENLIITEYQSLEHKTIHTSITRYNVLNFTILNCRISAKQPTIKIEINLMAHKKSKILDLAHYKKHLPIPVIGDNK